jgi:hypothetical protein
MPGLVNIDAGNILGGIGQLARDLRAAITGKEPINAEKAAELALKVQELQQKTVEGENSLLLAQAEINKIEAASSRFFNSGWRPSIGWVCSIALALTYWPRAVIVMVVWAKSIASTGILVPPPDLGLTDLIALLASILGIGGLRTYEKKVGVA